MEEGFSEKIADIVICITCLDDCHRLLSSLCQSVCDSCASGDDDLDADSHQEHGSPRTSHVDGDLKNRMIDRKAAGRYIPSKS